MERSMETFTFNQDAMLKTWKQQTDAAFRMIEALTESAERLHETQLRAAADAHADAVATQQSALRAKDAAELAQVQLQWARANAEKAIAYWRAMYEHAVKSGSELAACLSQADGREAKQ
jgi:phasin family protein